MSQLCVRHQDGWCAIKPGATVESGDYNVPTACGHYVILPSRINEEREPDCPECRNALESVTPEPTRNDA